MKRKTNKCQVNCCSLANRTSKWKGAATAVTERLETRRLFTALVWNPGTAGGAWDHVTKNWFVQGDATQTPVAFHDNDTVSFGDTGAGLVTIEAGGVAPSSMAFTNAATAYTLGGGAIHATANAVLDKSGAGNLTLTGTTPNTGFRTTLHDGTLTLNKSAGVDALPATAFVAGDVQIVGGTLQLAASDQIANSAYISIGDNTGHTGSFILNGNNETVSNLGTSGDPGTVVSTGSGTLNLTTASIGNGTVTVGAGGTINVSNTTSVSSGTQVNIFGRMSLGSGASTFFSGTNVVLQSGGVLTTDGGLFTSSGLIDVRPNAVMTVGTGGMLVNSTITLESDAAIPGQLNLNGNVSASGSPSKISNGGSGSLPGRINLGLATPAFNASTTLAVSAQIIGSGGINFSGGFLLLSGNNTYTGLTTVNSGFLELGNPNGLGSTSAGTVIGNNAQLDLNGQAVAENVTFTANGNLRNESGNSVVQGGGSNGQQATLSGTLTVSGNVTISGNNQLNISNTIGGAGGITVNIPGTTAQYNGTAANTYTGKTFVQDGTLLLNKPAGTNAIGASGNPAGDVVISGGNFVWAANNQVIDGAGIEMSGGLLNLNGKTDTIANTLMEISNSSAMTTGTNGSLTVTGQSVLSQGTLTIPAGGSLSTTGLTSLGDGIGGHTFAGNVAGTLNIGAGGGSEFSDFSGTSTTITVLSGGAINTTTGQLIIRGNKNEVRPGGAINISSGGLRLDNTSNTITLDASNTTPWKLNLSGDITDTAAFGSTIASGGAGTLPGVVNFIGDRAITSAGDNVFISAKMNVPAGTTLSVTTGSGNRLELDSVQTLAGSLAVLGRIDHVANDLTVGQTLSGTGNITGSGTTFVFGAASPGAANGASVGTLSTTNLNLRSGSSYLAQLETTGDQFNVTGTVNLAGGSLAATGSAPATSYILIQNDGADPVVGTFNGLPEGATVTVNSHTFAITYVGGDGNDVALVARAPTITASDAGGIYTGQPYAATANVTVTGGPPDTNPVAFVYSGTTAAGAAFAGSTAPTEAGAYSVTATVAAGGGFPAATSAAVNFVVAQAVPTIAVTDAGGTYSGAAFPAAPAVTGVPGGAQDNNAVTLTYAGTGSTAYGPSAAAPTEAGTYAVTASVAAGGDYAAASSTPVAFAIAKAAPVVTVADAGGTYSGAVFAATASVTGVANGATPPAATLAYYLGAGTGGTSLGSAAPTEAGTYSVVASVPASGDYAAASSTPLTFAITRAVPTVAVADAGGTYNGTAFAAAPSVVGVSGGAQDANAITLTYAGTGSTAYTPSTTAPTEAGTYAVTATVAAGGDYAAATSSPAAFTIAQAVPTVAVTDAGGTYGGTAFPATPAVTGVPGGAQDANAVTLTYAGTGATAYGPASLAPTDAGTYTVTAAVAAGGDYAAASSAPVGFTIARAAPAVTVSDPGGTYNGAAFPATATVTGVSGAATPPAATFEYYLGAGTGGASLGAAAPTEAGTYTVVASVPASGDYVAASSTPLTFAITRAVPTVTVIDAGGTYNGTAFAATPTVAAVPAGAADANAVSLSYAGTGSTTYSPSAVAPTEAGTYTVTASVAAGGDYAAASSAPVGFAITPATPAVAVSDAGGTYSGAAFPATASVTGVSGAATPPAATFTYYQGTGTGGASLGSAAPTEAGTYTVVASVPASGDYAAASSAPLTFVISQAVPTVTVADAGGTYNGTAFPATPAVTGVPAGAADANAVTLTYAGTGATAYSPSAVAPTEAGTYTVTASVAAGGDYAAASSSPAVFTIAQAVPVVTVADTGGTYNGTAFAATSAVTGVPGGAQDTNAVTLTYAGTTAAGTAYAPSPAAPTEAGTYTVAASVAAGGDYASASSAPVGFTIARAAPAVTVSDPGGTYNGAAFPATATVTGVSGAATPPAATLAYYLGTGTGGASLGAAAPTEAGTYTVVASVPASGDYAAAGSTPLTFVISQAVPTVAVTDAGGTYNGTAFPATPTVAGIPGGAQDANAVTITYAGTTAAGTAYGPDAAAPTEAGTYTVTASVAAGGDYAAASNGPVGFAIARATPAVTVSDSGGTYNGAAFPAAPAVAGVPGGAQDNNAVTVTYAGTTAAGTAYAPSTTAPTEAGTYSVTASVAAGGDYAAATSSPAAFTISQALPTVAVTDAGGTYSGSPFAATPAVAGAPQGMSDANAVTVTYAGTTAAGTAYGPTSLAPTNAGTYTVTAMVAAGGDYATATSAPVPFTIGQALPTVTVADAGGIYSGTAFPATPAVTGVPAGAADANAVTLTYAGTEATTYSPSAVAPTEAGTYTVTASVAAGGDYAAASSSPAAFTIAQATPAVTVSDAGGTYSGAAFPATATVTGVSGAATPPAATLAYYQGTGTGGASLGAAAPTEAGTYTVVASVAASGDYVAASSAPATFVINQAVPTVTVADAGGTYGGTAFPATPAVTGIPGGAQDANAVTLTYAGTGATAYGPGTTPPTEAGTYKVTATVAAGGDYATATSAPVPFTIGQALPTVTVTDAGGIYNGTTFAAAPTVAGVAGGSTDANAVTLTYAGTTAAGTAYGPSTTAPTEAGTYSVTATVAAGGDYAAASSAPVGFAITQAAPAVTVSDPGGTYNGTPFPAAAVVTGVTGGTAPPAATLAYYLGAGTGGASLGSAAPTEAGTYTVVASVPASGDYAAASSTPLTFTIARAVPTVTVADAGGTYNGTAFPATPAAAGVPAGAADANAVTLTYAGTTAAGTAYGPSTTAPTEAGTYSVTATVAAGGDYAAATSSPAAFAISQAVPTIAVADAGGTYNGSPFPATPAVTGVPAGAADANAVTLTYTGTGSTAYGPGTTPPTEAGTYTVTAAVAAGGEYAAATSAPVPFTIGQALPTVAVADGGGTYSGTAFAATPAVAGVPGGAQDANAVTLTYAGTGSTTYAPSTTAPTEAGTYAVTASVAAGGDYASASSAPVGFAIALAAPTVTVTNPGGTYSGAAFPATATVTGVSGAATPPPATLAYYLGTGTGGASLGSAAPTEAGTYTVVASIPASGDYAAASSTPLTFTIARAVATVTVADAGGTYNGSPFAATRAVAGVPGGAQDTNAVTLTYAGTGSTTYTPSTTAPTEAGTYTVTATVAAGGDYAAASSTPVAFAIAKAAPVVTVADAGGTYGGAAFPATATVTGVTGAATPPAATLAYYLGAGTGGTSLGSAAPTEAGTYTVVASVPASGDYAAASSTPLTFTISRAVPTIAVADAGGTYSGAAFAAAPAVAGVPGGAQDANAVTLTYAGTGSTAYSPTSLAPTNAGTYTVTAFVAAGGDYAAATSAPVGFSIARAAPTIHLTGPAAGSFVYGQAVTLTATLGPVAAGAAVPTGTVQFMDGTTLLGTATLSAGVATFTTSALTPGSNSISAVYSGDSQYVPAADASTPLGVSASADIILLDRTGSGALTDSGNGKIVVTGGSVVVDSSSTSAVIVGGNADLSAPLIDVTGGASVSGHGGVVGIVQQGVTVTADPLTGLAAPDPGLLPVRSATALHITGSQAVTLSPGVYVGGIIVDGSATVTLLPGVYYMKGGGFRVGGDATVTDNGAGVLIYNAPDTASDVISISGNSRVTLSAAKSGAYQGLTIFQARTSSAVVSFSGSATVNVTGTVYAAAAVLSISGNASVDSNGSPLDLIGSLVIVDDLRVTGSATLVVSA